MEREIEKTLAVWRDDPARKPLLVRGARQVGKSYAIEQFGRRHFESVVVADFELEPRLATCFEGSLEPATVLEPLSTLVRAPVTPGRTLLFLDEIQLCPRALMALRYFHERLPQLHVIAAGSLVDFALESEDFRMPVGRVQYLHMCPLSFNEFLDATGQSGTLAMLGAAVPQSPPHAAAHEHLIEQVRTYCAVGGMPAAVAEYVSSRDLSRVRRAHLSIMQTYRDDFAKYSSRARYPYLQQVFAAAPRTVGRKFRYAAVDREVPSRDLRQSLLLLEQAGTMNRVRQTSGAGLPLGAEASDRNFKVVFVDVGLMQNACDATAELVVARDLLAVYAGAVAEQLVGQELRSCGDPYVETGLHYWAREARSSNAEVDYLVASQGRVLPLEVKAGKSGALRSLHLFLQEYGAPIGLRVSARPLEFDGRLLNVPLYMVHQIPRLAAATMA